jgi:uncharacterized protein YndB with AHSA1/START domain
MAKKENQQHRGRIIRDEIRTTASPQQAWEAWADPEKIAQWFTDRALGEARAGSIVVWNWEKFFQVSMQYEVLESVPGERLALLRSAPGRDPGIIEVIIERAGGETVVRLVNSGFGEGAEWDEQYEGVASGWRMALALLKLCLENYFGEPRQTFQAFRPASFSNERLAPYFRDATELAQWLTVSGAIHDAGEPCTLALRGSLPLSGRVLARTSREVTVSWDEIRGVLELKAFAMGPQRIVGVRGCGWGLDAAQARKIEVQITGDVDRLVYALGSSSAVKA